MTLLFGLALLALAAGAFVYSLPRGGRTVPYVGTEWEGYVVAGLIGMLGIGLLLSLVGLAGLSK